MKGTQMQTAKTVPKTIRSTGAALALAIAALMPTLATAGAQPMPPMKGGEHTMMLNKEVKTTQDANPDIS